MKLNVFLNSYGTCREVGLLSEENGRIFFEYAPDFLTSGIELSPFKLPLKSGIFEDIKRTFDGLFGVFNDSLPDGWGCLLLDRKQRKRGLSFQEITPLQRLSMIGRDPMGALEYEPADEATDEFGEVELDSLSGEVDKIVRGDDSDVLDELLKLNGSSGGARPKIVAWVSEDRKTIVHGGKCRRPASHLGSSNLRKNTIRRPPVNWNTVTRLPRKPPGSICRRHIFSR